ncbi:sensor histidine kinase [Nesterenkonia halotolerans]|uniref:histidine kinase n=1 Tax=Nesterenkonia halotolerans TaxID=225325 RepID=A0ABR9J5G4_9MICC|nr:HAMP domain-containing sensor histidine kinase [Nesterenkonia halotolerans]MBE1514233.1 signal transduction histidine kinase [Nesterenkonia halotolerans]
MSHTTAPGEPEVSARSPRRRLRRRAALRPLSVRARILAAVVGLAALALAAAGYTAFAIQQAQVEGRIDAELVADAEQFRVLHEVGVDPSTGEPFTSPTELVRTAMERIIPTRNEGIVGLVDGQVAFTSAVTRVRLEEDPELLNLLEDYAVAERATVTTLKTETTTYRVAIVPIHGSAAPEDSEAAEESQVGALVMGYDMTAEKGVFADGFLIYAAVAALSLGVVAIVGGVIAGRLLHPVGVLASSARHIGREDLSERIPVTGKDDLTEMTKSVNEMLDRLEASFRSQDQLIHDVSHELRTPLTIVRGHLEVLDAEDRDDVLSTRELTLDELTRMNRVIDDLTTLAQAGRPDFLRRAFTDVGKLTDEVYDKAIALGERRWIVDSRAEGDSWLDRERLTQAWLQLAANAVKFSAPGSVISLGSELAAGEVRLFVRDQGQGIAEEDHERVFRRFGRTDSSKPGSGLGLPIVDAIAQAHGGWVKLESAPGMGARFTMVLPHLDEDPMDLVSEVADSRAADSPEVLTASEHSTQTNSIGGRA